MKHAILVGRKGDKEKAITDVLPYGEARQQLNGYRADSKSFKDLDSVALWGCDAHGNCSVTKAVVASNEKRNSKLAEVEAVPQKKGRVAAVAAMVLFAFSLSALGQSSILGNLNSATLNGTNTTDGGAMQWLPNQVFTLEAAVTCASTATNDIIVTIDESLGGTYWTLATQTKLFDCANHTNATPTLPTLTNTLCSRYWRISSLARANTNTATVNQLLIYKED